MRQTVKENKVPHFSTFGKNYTRRFKDTDLFEQIFTHILTEYYKFKLVDPTEIFVDATHVKARANSRKMQKRIAKEESLFYEELLKMEINEEIRMITIRPLAPAAQKKKKQSNAVQPIRKADGSEKGNTSMYSPMR